MARGDNDSGKGHVGFKLFGVEIDLEDELRTSESIVKKKRSHEGDDECMRKSKSMGNLHEMCNRDENHNDGGGGAGGDGGGGDSGYHSDGLLHLNSRRAVHIRKKGTPWTPSEHRSFLIGLKKLGKGDWKGISKNYVPTRTPTQVASHAQKYFIRMTASEKKNRRASLFDIPIKESNQPPRDSTAAPFSASEGFQQVMTAAVAPLKKTNEIRGLDGLSAHIAASEKKPPLSPAIRTYVPDTCHIPYMAGVPGQSFIVAGVTPQTELYPMMNCTNYQNSGYYYVPSSHKIVPVPFMNQKSNGVFLQPYPILHRTSQARPATGSFATSAQLPNHYQIVADPSTSFANQYHTANGPATSTVAKKDGLEASIGALSL